MERSDSEHVGCLPAMGCGCFTFILGIMAFMGLCLMLKGIFQ